MQGSPPRPRGPAQRVLLAWATALGPSVWFTYREAQDEMRKRGIHHGTTRKTGTVHRPLNQLVVGGWLRTREVDNPGAGPTKITQWSVNPHPPKAERPAARRAAAATPPRPHAEPPELAAVLGLAETLVQRLRNIVARSS